MGHPRWGSTPGPRDHDLSRRQMLNPLSHPGAPTLPFFKLKSHTNSRHSKPQQCELDPGVPTRPRVARRGCGNILSQAARVTKDHKPGAHEHETFVSLSSGGWTSVIQLLETSVSGQSSRLLGGVLLGPHVGESRCIFLRGLRSRPRRPPPTTSKAPLPSTITMGVGVHLRIWGDTAIQATARVSSHASSPLRPEGQALLAWDGPRVRSSCPDNAFRRET